jgi:hypothetical protein
MVALVWCKLVVMCFAADTDSKPQAVIVSPIDGGTNHDGWRLCLFVLHYLSTPVVYYSRIPNSTVRGYDEVYVSIRRAKTDTHTIYTISITYLVQKYCTE